MTETATTGGQTPDSAGRTARWKWNVIYLTVIGAVLAVIATGVAMRHPDWRRTSYPERIVASGDDGGQAWSIVAWAVDNGDGSGPVPCTKVRIGGRDGAGGCDVKEVILGKRQAVDNVGELGGDRLVFFGQTSSNVTSVEYHFPGEDPVRVVTVEERGLPCRFFHLVRPPGSARSGTTDFDRTLRLLDSAGKSVPA